MAASKPDTKSNTVSDEDVKAPNVFKRAKEEFDAVIHKHHRHKETHGLRDDITEDTPVDDVKAPNVFERAKEEIDAIVGAIHPKKEPTSCDSVSSGETRDSVMNDCSKSHSEKNGKSPNFIIKVKEEIESLTHKPRHHKETHGTSNDLDENTPISEVKGPNVFERAKEEIEALIQTIHPRKEKD